MATKTVVCPECGAPAAPGRFACSDCGALLAAVGPKPVRRRRTSTGRSASAPDPARGPTQAEDPVATVGAAPEPVAAAAMAPEPATPTTPTTPTPAAPGSARTPAPSAAPAFAIDPDEADDREIDEDAPIAAAVEPEWPGAPVAPAWLSSLAAAQPEPEPAARRAEPAVEELAAPGAPLAPAWPPVGAATPLEAPAPRTPAGTYLAPSAVLPPLDAPASRNGGAPRSATSATAVDAKPQASLAETLDAFGITADAPRRLIGGGAAIAALGFLLPWADVVIGSGLAGSYWARWGMAGPGHWIVVGLLVALVVVALARDRLARVPVGPIAIGLGMLLVGLVWPYLFGVIGHSVGVWLVLVGALVLGAGGILDLRRHATASPDV